MVLKGIILFSILAEISWAIVERAKNNGDIYVVNERKFVGDHQILMQKEYVTTVVPETKSMPNVDPNLIDFEAVIALCNSSFSIPMDYYNTFTTLAELPNLVDKTGMCFIRCLYEKSGLIENWKLNSARIRRNMWPAMGDSIEVCEKEAAKEVNPCVRTYAIAKCLTLRCLTDARDKYVS